MAKSINQVEDFPLQFTSHCVGRYQIQLPADMQQIQISYVEPGMSINADPKSLNEGILRGNERLVQWQAFVEKKRLEDEKYRASPEYIIKDLKPALKSAVYYADYRKLSVDPNYNHRFISFFLKDFPEQKVGVMIDAGGIYGSISRSITDYRAIFMKQLAIMQGRANLVTYQPWPHQLAGVCLTNQFILHTEQPGARERYRIKFYNGKNSTLGIDVTTYDKGREAVLKEELARNSGLISFLASSKMKVAGREGRLFISDSKYSSTAREFRWVSTDSKVASIDYIHIEIEGKIEIKDYPEAAPLKSSDMVVGILKFIQIRPNGMAGVKENFKPWDLDEHIRIWGE